MSQENVEVVRRLWQAAERRDNEAVFALYDPDIVWDTRADDQIAGGLYRGHEGVRQFFRAWLDSFGAFHTQAETFIEVGEKVLVGYRISGRGKESGVEVDMPGGMCTPSEMASSSPSNTS